MWLQIPLWIFLAVLAYTIASLISVCMQHKKYQNQGVTFTRTNPIASALHDAPKFLQVLQKHPYGLPYRQFVEASFPTLAPILGVNIANDIQFLITCPKILQQIYVDVNKFHSKH